jgi:hypothetical protein
MSLELGHGYHDFIVVGSGEACTTERYGIIRSLWIGRFVLSSHSVMGQSASGDASCVVCYGIAGARALGQSDARRSQLPRTALCQLADRSGVHFHMVSRRHHFFFQ